MDCTVGVPAPLPSKSVVVLPANQRPRKSKISCTEMPLMWLKSARQQGEALFPAPLHAGEGLKSVLTPAQFAVVSTRHVEPAQQTPAGGAHGLEAHEPPEVQLPEQET